MLNNTSQNYFYLKQHKIVMKKEGKSCILSLLDT